MIENTINRTTIMVLIKKYKLTPYNFCYRKITDQSDRFLRIKWPDCFKISGPAGQPEYHRSQPMPSNIMLVRKLSIESLNHYFYY